MSIKSKTLPAMGLAFVAIAGGNNVEAATININMENAEQFSTMYVEDGFMASSQLEGSVIRRVDLGESGYGLAPNSTANTILFEPVEPDEFTETYFTLNSIDFSSLFPIALDRPVAATITLYDRNGDIGLYDYESATITSATNDTLLFGNTDLSHFTLSTPSGEYFQAAFDNVAVSNVYTVNAPEPGTGLAVGSGLLLLLARRRKGERPGGLTEDQWKKPLGELGNSEPEALESNHS